MAYKAFSSDNASQLYMDTLLYVMQYGEECRPRGTVRKEVQAVITYENPLIRTTFLKGRRINPFFQLAESFWILMGRADVKFLTRYNKNMANFSDDGLNFHAPYGERLRKWNHSEAHNFTFNPIDQLYDVYMKLVKDPDSSQAVASIWNPMFDNSSYITKDIPCNDLLKFKLRNGRLNLTVNNRSNDIHWGTFGANLAQFATIQELVASWLGVEVGVYNQESDSLHIYTQDYGHKITGEVLDAYGVDLDLVGVSAKMCPKVQQFSFPDEPRMSVDYGGFYVLVKKFEQYMEPALHDPSTFANKAKVESLIEMIHNVEDEYFRQTLLAMFVYQAHKAKESGWVIEALSLMEAGSWKVSCLYFLYPKYSENQWFRNLYASYNQETKDYIEGR
jgi:thymidylate synthase